jgi:beta-mannosidase
MINEKTNLTIEGLGGDELVEQKTINKEWYFQQLGSDNWLPAIVPGCVHTDLLNAQLIDDPFYGSNEKALQWISGEDWIYRTTFEINDHELGYQQIELVFEGLDTHASVKLNGIEILTTDNMFRTWDVDVKRYLKSGENSLEIYFHSAEKFNQKQAAKLPYTLPEDERVHSRKAPYQFGWDWAPRFITAGVWRPVYLRMWNNARITNVFIFTSKINKDLASITTRVTIAANQPATASLGITSPENAFGIITRNIELTSGQNTVNIDFEIENPILWWANGMGAAHLYNIHTELNTSYGSHHSIVRFGLRNIELVQQEDESGRSFEFHLNGVPVFAKGANIVPMDSFPTRLKQIDYERIVVDAVKANFNMLRVWGGGYYKDKTFYDLCDEHGIMVWQDFMFACAMYPGGDDFINTVREEIKNNVRELRNHPSIALWCGNNEISNGWADWNWPTRFNYLPDHASEVWQNYEKIFEKLIPEVLSVEDPSRPYWPSSPLYGWGHDEATRIGDNHYWGVWWGMEPFVKYREKVSRFMSEFGFQSFPSWETVKSFSMEEDRYLFSDVMRSHQKHPTGNETIDKYMKSWYPEPKDFESLVYLSQVLQAEGMIIGINAHRRSMPYCMGTLYWQYNDCWPVASWSSVDYYGNWKALHYYARKAYSNICLIPETENNRFRLYLVSDLTQNTQALLTIQLFAFNGNLKHEQNKEVIIATNSQLVIDLPESEMLKGQSGESSVMIVTLTQDGKTIASNHHYFEIPKKLKMEKPLITFETKKVTEGYKVQLNTNTLARNVFLHFPETKGWWNDNFFELIPGQPKTIIFETSEILPDHSQKLQIRSLADAFI